MSNRFITLLILALLAVTKGFGQRPFAEGVVVYKVSMQTADHKEYKGTYTYTFKGAQVKKDLKLSNGYEDIVLFNCGVNSVYSLQNKGSKKYAIQLSMDQFVADQRPFANYTLKNEATDEQRIAGYATMKGEVSYTDGSNAKIRYTKEWYPAQSITFERFPDARFFPLSFTYTDRHGVTMQFEAAEIKAGPVENAMFRIPADYRIISYAEYKELSR